MQLIVNVSTGKGTWADVSRIMAEGQWDKILVITNDFGKKNFTHNKQFESIGINPEKDIDLLIEELKPQIKQKVKDLEVGVNLASGSGKEHMAIISALLQNGIGVRFVALTASGIKEF
ncbi:hypothetical protein HZB00_00705 [Candidatus Woesearchaeota archaeon]|nr:hypothetical protein [Candidatus Woesearchaeota archaeon]